MADLVLVSVDLQQLDDLTHEFLTLLRAPDVARGSLCGVWLRMGIVLSDSEACACGLRTLIRIGAQES